MRVSYAPFSASLYLCFVISKDVCVGSNFTDDDFVLSF